MRITVSREGQVVLGESVTAVKQDQSAADVAPKELENFYAVCVESLHYITDIFFSVLKLSRSYLHLSTF